MQYFTGATTLGAPSKPVEIKIPLWWADGTSVSIASTITASGTNFLNDGTTTLGTSGTASPAKLFTLSANWPASTKLALEITGFGPNNSVGPYAVIWDCTSNASVSSSQVSALNSTAVMSRSGQFTLTPGHQYGISVFCGSYNVNLIDASLIVFP